MEATTLPTLLLGGDAAVDPDETFAAWEDALGAARRARADRRPHPPVPARRRCRRGPSTPPQRSSTPDGTGAAVADHDMSATTSAGSTAGRPRPRWLGESSSTLHRPAGDTRASASRSSTRRRARALEHGRVERIVVPLAGSFTVQHTEGSTTEATRLAAARRCSTGRPTCSTSPRPPRGVRHGSAGSRSRRPRRARSGRERTSRRRDTRRAARRGRLQPPGAQLRHARRRWMPRADRVRGHHAGRELVVVPAAQARRARRRVTSRASRRSTTSRPRRRRIAATLRRRMPRSACSPRTRRPRARSTSTRWCAPATSPSSRTATTARRRGPGLRPLLPQRHGRSRPRAGLAHQRRPGARLGPRHLERPGRRCAPAVRRNDQKEGRH